MTKEMKSEIGRKKKKQPSLSGFYKFVVDRGYSTTVILSNKQRDQLYAEYIMSLS